MQPVFREEGIENAFPLRIKFKDKIGIDTGGLYREMLCVFWQSVYENVFDGGCLLTPDVRPDTDLSALPVIGKIISHGYICSGFLPVKVAFPTLASFLLPGAEIGDHALMTAFLKLGLFLTRCK